MKLLPLLFLSSVLLGCASSGPDRYLYNEIRVVNDSTQILRNLSIRVPGTGAEFSCGNIAPLGLCANRFGPRTYQHNPILIEWSYGDGQRRTSEFIVPVPANFATGVPLQGVVEVSETGEMRVYFLQEAKYN